MAVFAGQLILKVKISHEMPSCCVCLVVFFRPSRQCPMCIFFFNNSVNYIRSMAAKVKANHKQINQQNGQLGEKSWQRSNICLATRMITFRFENEIWLLFFSRIPKKLALWREAYIYFLLTRKVSTVIFTIARR